jgi:hypothetical protein
VLLLPALLSYLLAFSFLCIFDLIAPLLDPFRTPLPQEHMCSYIFRFELLDIGNIARSYALLRLPKIPETRGVKGRPVVFEMSSVDTSKVPYAHREKEQARVRRLAANIEKEKERVAAEEEALGWGVNDDGTVKTGKSGRTNRTGRTIQDWVPPEEYVEPNEPKRKRKKKETKHQKIVNEWDELDGEERAYKKFKKGKLTKEEYEACLTNENSVEVDSDTGEIVLIPEGGGDDGDDSDDDDEEGGKAKARAAKAKRYVTVHSISFTVRIRFAIALQLPLRIAITLHLSYDRFWLIWRSNSGRFPIASH